MSHELLTSLSGQIFADIARSNSTGIPLSSLVGGGNRGSSPKSVQASENDDMDTRLRNIRRYVTPKEFAALIHCHICTVYRKIKAGMPVDHDFDGQGRCGRRHKIYPPQYAEWQRNCRSNQLTSPSPWSSSNHPKLDNIAEPKQ